MQLQSPILYSQFSNLVASDFEITFASLHSAKAFASIQFLQLIESYIDGGAQVRSHARFDCVHELIALSCLIRPPPPPA